MLRLFKAIRRPQPDGGVVCPSPGKRKDFGYLSSGNRESGTPGGGLQARAGPGRRRPGQLGHHSQPLAQRCGVNERSSLTGVWADIPALVASRDAAVFDGNGTGIPANSFLKIMEELEVSSSFAALLENLSEPSLYKRAGVMRAVINLHPSPPPPSTRLSLSGRILKKQ
jgi:hypothetical protein